MREPRIAVMILGEASWQDAGGATRKMPVWMEDRSEGGACLRVKMRLGVGVRVQVRCRHEQFTGVSKYCRHDGKEFLVGIQRDTTSTAPIPPPAEDSGLRKEIDKGATAAPHHGREPVAEPMMQISPALAAAASECAAIVKKAEDENTAELAVSQKVFATPPARSPEQPQAKACNPVNMRKPMRTKLLELARWNTSKQSARENTLAVQDANRPEPEMSPEQARAVVPRLQVNLLSTEDIYRSAGILNVQGCGVHKVIEMLGNEHIRGLSNEMKRAAVLMALDAAGIAVDHVLRDAKARQEALDSYESNQRKELETEWSRKAEENLRIEAELERIKEQYTARIARNQESMEREKATFNAWLKSKQQESQNITEAAALCRSGGEAKSMQAAAAQA